MKLIIKTKAKKDIAKLFTNKNVKDSKLLNESIKTSEKDYSIDEVAKECGIDMNETRIKHKKV